MSIKYKAVEFGYGFGVLGEFDTRKEADACIHHHSNEGEGRRIFVREHVYYRVEVEGCDHSKKKAIFSHTGIPGKWYNYQCEICESMVGGAWNVGDENAV